MSGSPSKFTASPMMKRLTMDVFELDSAIESVLNMFEKDVVAGSDQLPESAGRIKVVINKKEEEYELSLQSNGRGITREEVESTLSVVGQSSITGGKNATDDLWILAPFYFAPDSYIFASNPRVEGEPIVANSTPSGFEMIEDSDVENTFGLTVELTISTDEHTVPEIGERIRDTVKESIEVPVEYELQENGVSKKQIYINY